MRNLILCFILMLFINCTNKGTIQPKTVEYYLEEYKSLVHKNLQNRNALNDSMKLKVEYFDEVNGKKTINRKGIEVYTHARTEAHKTMFQHWNYMNHLTHNEYVYAIYFTIVGVGDLSWQVIRFKKDQWHKQEQMPLEIKSPLHEYLDFDPAEFGKKGYNTIIYNYDEGEPNIENVRLFVENNYLVFERGNLMHSLYDIKNEELMFNEISPWYQAKQMNESTSVSKESLNEWITNNLHNRIAQKINAN